MNPRNKRKRNRLRHQRKRHSQPRQQLDAHPRHAPWLVGHKPQIGHGKAVGKGSHKGAFHIICPIRVIIRVRFSSRALTRHAENSQPPDKTPLCHVAPRHSFLCQRAQRLTIRAAPKVDLLGARVVHGLCTLFTPPVLPITPALSQRTLPCLCATHGPQIASKTYGRKA